MNLWAKPKVLSVLEKGLLGIARSQLGELQNQVDYMKKGLDFEKKMYDMEEQYLKDLDRSLSGQYDLGKLYNGAADQAKRRWSSGQGNAEVVDLKKAHQSKFRYELGKFSSGTEKTTFEQAKKSQEDAFVAAEYVNQHTESHINTIEGLMQKIDTSPNQKAATDLNSRIQAQVALELIELKHLQALQLESLGSLNQQYLSGKSQSANFNSQKGNSDE